MSAALEQEEDLEALFDAIAEERDALPPASTAAAVATPVRTPPQVPAMALSAVPPSSGSLLASEASAGGGSEAGGMFERIGSLTRNLHDALKQLGYDRQVEGVVDALPDARARLHYIARLTGQAADTALSKSEAGIELQTQMAQGARALAVQWDAVFAGDVGVDTFRSHAERTRAFLHALPQQTAQTNSLFSDIMLAQDFHDLTGQVINRVVSMAEQLEQQLVRLLLDSTPGQRLPLAVPAGLAGPMIDAAACDDVVANQAQVDDLLASMGF